MATAPAPARRSSNLLGLDYRAEAAKLGAPPAPIIDIHSHINGEAAARVYREARDLYGCTLTYSMSQMVQVDNVRRALGDTVRFIAVPEFMNKDRAHAFGAGFIEAITKWHALGSRMVKFWSAPRGRDMGREVGDWSLVTLHSPWRRKQMDHAAGLGMMFMAHIADPDTWFKTKYADATLYGTKASQYEPLEELVEEYKVPWIIAHMGGWPEDLGFLSGLLSRHDHLHLDTSATKWMVREISKHPSPEFVAFLRRWKGRILFGSDIVTTDAHLGGTPSGGPQVSHDAHSPEEAFELYASRYWALRTMYETGYDGPSPIADPDLKMVEPSKCDEMSAPPLRGHRVPADLLKSIYHDAAERVVGGWIAKHP